MGTASAFTSYHILRAVVTLLLEPVPVGDVGAAWGSGFLCESPRRHHTPHTTNKQTDLSGDDSSFSFSLFPESSSPELIILQITLLIVM